ncbi:hypothetical protein ACPJHQ_01335 [Rossellomorea sp. H39__3]
MIGKKMVAVVFVLLMLTFVASVYVLPAAGLEEKDTSTSYKQTVFNESKVGASISKSTKTTGMTLWKTQPRRNISGRP